MMTASLIALHVLAAAFWLGAMLFLILFLVPTAARLGPQGGAFMGELVRSKFPIAFGIAGGTTILSGFIILWIVSGGFQPAFMRSETGVLISLGALTGIIAGILGGTIGRAQATGKRINPTLPATTVGFLTIALILMVIGAHI